MIFYYKYQLNYYGITDIALQLLKQVRYDTENKVKYNVYESGVKESFTIAVHKSVTLSCLFILVQLNKCVILFGKWGIVVMRVCLRRFCFNMSGTFVCSELGQGTTSCPGDCFFQLLRYVLTMVLCMCFMSVLIYTLFMVLGVVLMSVVWCVVM